jgi:hypothetical protein
LLISDAIHLLLLEVSLIQTLTMLHSHPCTPHNGWSERSALAILRERQGETERQREREEVRERERERERDRDRHRHRETESEKSVMKWKPGILLSSRDRPEGAQLWIWTNS